MNLSDFDFELPDNLIALNPLKPRDSSKLLRVNSLGEFEDSIFSNITKYLSDGDLLVVNDTKVMPSFIDGFKMNQRKDLTKISFTFFENLQNGQWKALARPAKKININDLIFFKDKNDQIHKLFAQIINKNEGEVTFDFAEDPHDIGEKVANLDLNRILIIGVEEDYIFPFQCQEDLYNAFSNQKYSVELLKVPSINGHDSFLVDYENFGSALAKFFK